MKLVLCLRIQYHCLLRRCINVQFEYFFLSFKTNFKGTVSVIFICGTLFPSVLIAILFIRTGSYSIAYITSLDVTIIIVINYFYHKKLICFFESVYLEKAVCRKRNRIFPHFLFHRI